MVGIVTVLKYLFQMFFHYLVSDDLLDPTHLVINGLLMWIIYLRYSCGY